MLEIKTTKKAKMINFWMVKELLVSGSGKGNGNPLQCSCLENPRDREPGGLPSVGSHRGGHD